MLHLLVQRIKRTLIDGWTDDVRINTPYEIKKTDEYTCFNSNLEFVKKQRDIVDQIGDTYSEQFADNMRSLLLQKYEISASVGKRIKKDALNICVIHNVEYYEGIRDPHDNTYDGVAVQHVTLEDFADNAEFAISTVIHKVLI